MEIFVKEKNKTEKSKKPNKTKEKEENSYLVSYRIQAAVKTLKGNNKQEKTTI